MAVRQKIVKLSDSGELAVLLVEGLSRPAVTLSEPGLSLEAELHLEAFPPAQYIAKGARPLLQPVSVVRDESSDEISISPATPLPFVTGALMNHCGYLAGLSLTQGAQNLDTDISPVAMFANELGPVLDSMQISLSVASCVTPIQQTDHEVGAGDDNDVTVETPDREAPPGPGEAVESSAAEIHEPTTAEPLTDTRQDDASDPDKPVPLNVAERPSLWRSVPWWLFVAGFIVLAVLVWKVALLLRPARFISRPQPASDEPDTIQLQAGSDSSVPVPRSGHVDEVAMPDMNDLPEGCNAIVMIEGQLDAETNFRRFGVVDANQVDIVIGRGNADICIEHPAISRAHARFECDGKLMTLSDLGSSNGTYIKGVPCLPGEILVVGPDDEIFLGDVRFFLNLIRKETQPS